MIQTATPDQQTAWQKIAACALAVIIVNLALACAIGSSRLINEPFPGFLVLENRVIASNSLSHWPIAQSNKPFYQYAITAVNGHPIATGKEVYTAVKALPVGSPITYTLEKDGQTTRVTFPSLVYQLKDYVFLQGAYLATSLVVGAIGLVVWFLQPTLPASRALFVQCFTLSLYILTVVGLYSSYWFLRLHVLCEALFPASFIHLALVFPVNHLRRHRAIWITVPYGLTLCVGLAYEITLFQPAWYTWFHTSYESSISFGMFILLSGVAWDYWRSDSLLIRQRIGVILLGVFGGFVVPALLFFSSSFTGGEVAVNNAVFTVFLFPLSIGYAIVKHDLFEIDTLLKRSVYYLTLTALLMLAYLGIVAVLNRTIAGSTVTQSPLFTLFFTAAVIVLLNPLKDYTQRGIDRLFFRVQYNPQAVLEAASNTLASTLRLDEILSCLWETVSENLGIRQGAIYLLNTDKSRYVAVHPLSAFPYSLASSSPLVTVLQDRKERALSEYHVDPNLAALAEAEGVQQAFWALDAHLIVPLSFQGNLIGMIALGRKESGRFFSSADIDFLCLLAHQGVLALSNARTYQRVGGTEQRA